MIKALIDIAHSDNSLRPYQIDSKQEIYEAWAVIRSVLFQMPTGTGKTRIFASIIKDIRDVSVQKRVVPQPRILILVHRTELINQIYDTLLHKYHIICGIIKSGFQETPEAVVQIASVQSLSRRLSRWKDVPFGYIVIDEAHHTLAKTYLSISKLYPGAKILGVTATPCRLSRESFRKIFDKLIVSKSVQQFIDEGYLSPFRYYSIKPDNDLQYDIDSINVFGANGDYAEQELMKVCDKTKIRARLIKSYKDYALGKKGIVYSINKTHNKHIASQYEEIGVRVATIDADTPESERKKIVNDFRAGRVDIICNVNIFSEGFDCPDVDFVQLARPTLSLSLYLQQVGRALRKSEGKDCALILDNVGSYNKFGLPTKPRNWDRYFNGFEYRETLSAKRKIKKKSHQQEIKEADEDMILIDSAGDIKESDALQYENSGYTIFDILSTFEQFPIGVRQHLYDLESAYWRSHGEIEHEKLLYSLNRMPIADRYNSLEEYILDVEDNILEYEMDYDGCDSIHFMHENTFMFSANGKYGVCRLKSPHKNILDVCNKIKEPSIMPPISNYFEELLEPLYDKIEVPNSKDVFIAVKNGKYGVINGGDLTTIIPFKYDDIQEVPFLLHYHYIVRKKSKEGVLDHNGEVVIPIQYDTVYLNQEDGLFVCEQDEKYIIALNGKLIHKLENTKVKQLTGTLSVYSLRKNNHNIVFLTDNDGCVVFPYSATDIFLTQNENEICLEFRNKHLLLDYDLNLKTSIVEGAYPRRKKTKRSSADSKIKDNIAEKVSKVKQTKSLDIVVEQKCEQVEEKPDVKHKRPRIRRVIPHHSVTIDIKD